MVPPGEGNEARGDGRRGVGVSHSTAEAGELSPRDPVEGRGHRQVAPVEGKTANTPRLGPVSTSRHRIAELARQALGMAVAIAWLPGPAGTRRRVAKPSVEEPDAAEPARPDLWGARVSNDPGLPDLVAQALTEPTADDATTGVGLVTGIPGDVASVTADAAYDTIAFYDAGTDRGARVVVPPARTASLSRRTPRSRVRDRTIGRVQALGRRRWQKAAGYHRQARVENAVFRYKSIIGPGLRARTTGGRKTEALLACNVLNRMTELGRPASYRIGH